MTEPQPRPRSDWTVRADQPVIGVIDHQNGTNVVHSFTHEAEAGQALADAGIQRALRLAGAWKEIDSEDFLDALDRVRHPSAPTPPIELPELEPRRQARR